MPARWVNGEATPPLATHDWLGFDLDHALCRYRVPALMELIYNCLVAALIELHAYPAEALAQPWDICKLQKGVIADFHTGDLLKLDAEGRIVRAFHGTRRLSAAEVASMYGPGAWPGFSLVKQRKRHRSFFDLLTYFDSPCQQVIQQLVDLVDAQAAATLAAGASAAAAPAAGAAGGSASVPAASAHQPPAPLVPSGLTTSYDEIAIEPRYRRIRDDLIDVFTHIFDNIAAWDSE